MNLRFAPTLNNSLHIGNVRILLYNYNYSLYRHNSIILRIDDKNVDSETEKVNLNNLNNLLEFLNIKVSKTIFQINRQDIYNKYFNSISEKYIKLIGDTYFINIEQVKKEIKYITFNDETQNYKKKAVNNINSIPILSNNKYFYNFKSVVDDINCEITTIIRGADHIDNTYLQIVIYYILGYYKNLPAFNHISLLHDSNNRKLSKSNYNNIEVMELIKENAILKESLIEYLTNNKIYSTKKQKCFNINALNQLNIAKLRKEKPNNIIKHPFIKSIIDKNDIKDDNFIIDYLDEMLPVIKNHKDISNGVKLLINLKNENNNSKQVNNLENIIKYNKKYDINIAKEIINYYNNKI